MKTMHPKAREDVLTVVAEMLSLHNIDLVTGSQIVQKIRERLTPKPPSPTQIVHRWIMRTCGDINVRQAFNTLLKRMEEQEEVVKGLQQRVDTVVAETVEEVLRIVEHHAHFYLTPRSVKELVHAVRAELANEKTHAERLAVTTAPLPTVAGSGSDEVRIGGAPLPNSIYRPDTVHDATVRPLWVAERSIHTGNETIVIRGVGPTPLNALEDYGHHWARLQQQAQAQVEGP